MDACKRYKRASVQEFVSVCVETRRREDMASQTHKAEMHDAATNTHGVDSHHDKTQGQPKEVRRKQKLTRTKMRPRKLQRQRKWHTVTRTLQSKHRRKRKAVAKQARKTIRPKSKRVQREKKNTRLEEPSINTDLVVIRLPVEIVLPITCRGF